MSVESSEQENLRLWRRASLWLLFLGPFFFLSYGFANWLAAQQNDVPTMVFAWEKQIPFIAWTIIPYWLIDLFYVISVFICKSKLELDRHAKRLLCTQIIAVICFILFPLAFSFDRPESTGTTGFMFATLNSFDKPFNQAPSLHIALLILLWVLYVRHLPKYLLWPCHALAILIGISVLTTYQHHFIDIPTGMLLGFLCIWLWPNIGEVPIRHIHITKESRRKRFFLFYAIAASLFALIATLLGGTALWLFWPASSLLLLSFFYLFIGASGFQKNRSGLISLAAQWLLYPYLIAARINSRLWALKIKPANHIIDNVFLGRFPTIREINLANYSTVIDMTAEFSAPKTNAIWHAIPTLDLITPNVQTLISAAGLIEQSDRSHPLLVCCALGYSRSTLALIAWLLISKRAESINRAINIVKKARPGILIKESDHMVLEKVVNFTSIESNE